MVRSLQFTHLSRIYHTLLEVVRGPHKTSKTSDAHAVGPGRPCRTRAREGTSKIVYPSSRQLRRPAAPESDGSITVWYGQMGTMPFNRSRGRLAAGKASDRSGVVVRHTTTSRVLGGWILRYRVGALDLLLKRATVLSAGGTGRWARCHRSGRQTDQRPEISENCLPRAPGWGAWKCE